MSRQLVDESLLKQFFTEEIDSEASFFEKLFSQFQTQLEELRSDEFSETTDNLESVGRLVHKIKSSCRYFGAVELETILGKLEVAAAQGEVSRFKQLYSLAIEVFPETLLVIDNIYCKVLIDDKSAEIGADSIDKKLSQSS